MTNYAENLRRLMAYRDLDLQQVVERSGLSRRTVLGVLKGTTKPRTRTLRRLADGMGVSVDELFQDASLLLHKHFDRATNPFVQEVVHSSPDLFTGWTEADFDELYSRFGTGGEMSPEGVEEAAQQMNQKRDIYRKVAVVMESEQADLLRNLVEVLYQRVVIHS